MTHTLYLRTDTREQLEDVLIAAGMLPAEPDAAPALPVTAFELDWLPHPLVRVVGEDEESGEPVTEVVEGCHANLRVRHAELLVPLVHAGVVIPEPERPLRRYALA